MHGKALFALKLEEKSCVWWKSWGGAWFTIFQTLCKVINSWTLSLKNSTHLYHHTLPWKYYTNKIILWTKGHAPPVILVNIIILVIIRITVVLILFLPFSYVFSTFTIFFLGFQNVLPFIYSCFSKTTDSLRGRGGKCICIVLKGQWYFLCTISLPWLTYLIVTFWFYFFLFNLDKCIRWWC